jgi:iron-sulfur cluster assembly protein
MVITESKPVTMTEGAIRANKKADGQENFDATQKLRVGVKGGGCSGMSYILGSIILLKKISHLKLEGISFIMNAAHEMYVYGMEIDWQDGLKQSWLYFQNP